MALGDGMYSLGSESGRLLLKTSRTGMGAKAGHDLTIEVTRWLGTANITAASPAHSSVTVEMDVESFEVREGTGGLKSLTDADRVEIKKTIREKLLHTERHPKITFRSRQVAGTPEAFTITGDLTIVGVTRPATVNGAIGGDGRVRGTATVVQSQWGIKPYSAFLGALKLRDEVQVLFDTVLARET